MRRLLLAVILASGLSGCALIDAYLMAGFDPNEYQLITEIRVEAERSKAQCSDAIVSKINAQIVSSKTHLFERYSEEIPRNKNGLSAARSLNEIAQGLVIRYNGVQPVSTAFCKLKFESIESSAKLMQHVTGNRPR
jgi:hypothetical protein